MAHGTWDMGHGTWHTGHGTRDTNERRKDETCIPHPRNRNKTKHTRVRNCHINEIEQHGTPKRETVGPGGRGNK